jgi:hypothetical protein
MISGIQNVRAGSTESNSLRLQIVLCQLYYSQLFGMLFTVVSRKETIAFTVGVPPEGGGLFAALPRFRYRAP